MIEPRTFLKALILSVLIAGLLVGGRFVWCLVAALRVRRYGIAAVSAAGLIIIAGLLAAVVVVWFGYAVAHTEKNLGTDLTVLLATAPPYFLASIGLWLLGGRLRSRLQP